MRHLSLKSRVRRTIGAILAECRGAASVELAVALPALLLLGLGAVNQGHTIVRNMQLANAVRSGTQYAVVRAPVAGDLSQIVDAVRNTAPPDTTGTQNISVAHFCECPDGSAIACDALCPSGEDRRAFVTVTLTETYPKLIEFPGMADKTRLRQEATVRLN